MSLRGGPSGRRGNPHPPRSGPPRMSAPTWLSLWESCRRSRLRGPAGASVILCPPITGNSPCHVIARRPIGPTRQSASPAKRAAEDVGPYLALPLGELSAQPTERACRGVGSAPPVGPALPGRVKPGPYKAPLIPDCQNASQSSRPAGREVFHPFFAAACTSRKILCASTRVFSRIFA